IDYKAVLFNYLRHWKWFVLSTALCLLISFLYLRYSTPEYRIYSNVLIKDGKSGGGGDISAAFQDLSISNANQSISNEIAVLKGKPLMWRVMQELNLQATYYGQGKVKTVELYGNTLPIQVIFSRVDSASYGSTFSITLKDQEKFVL